MEFFNGMTIEKYTTDSGGLLTGRKFIRVPVQYASGDKWTLIYNSNHKHLMAGEEKDTDRLEMEWVLPRISVNMTGMTYDSQRHLNKTNRIAAAADAAGNRIRTFSPVPYNLDVEVTVISRTLDSMFQVVEQIVPFFTPSKSIDVKLFDELEAESIPIVLQSISTDYPEEMDETEIRLYTTTMTFLVKANYYLPKKPQKIVKDVTDNLRMGPDAGDFGVNPATGQPYKSYEEAYAAQNDPFGTFDTAFGKFDQFVQNALNPNPVGEYDDRANTDMNPAGWLRIHVEK